MQDAARREVHEETGLTGVEVEALELTGPVLEQTIEFTFHGVVHEQYEQFFVARVEGFEVTSALWTPLERDVMVEHRWWSVAEIEKSTDVIYPDVLARLVSDALEA